MKKALPIILLCFAALVVAFFTIYGLSVYLGHLASTPLSKPPVHGTAFLVETDSGETNLALLEEALMARVDNLGMSAYMEPVSASRLRIEVPFTNSTMIGKFRDNIARAGHLEFRLVNDNSGSILANNESIPPGYEVMQSLEMGPGQQSPETLVVKTKAEEGVSGNFVKSAYVAYGSMGEPEIAFDLTDDGAKAFARLTTEYSPDPQTGQKHRLALMLDGKVYSAPVIADPITSGSCQITGSFTEGEAQSLVSVLNHPLPEAVNVVDMRTF
jgi:preprotein translocase subunit SecD